MMDGLLTPANTATEESLEKVFVFCMIWSMGSSLTVSDDGSDYQKLFSDWWRSEWKTVKFPSRETVFDYWLDPETGAFEQWTKSPYFFSIDYDSRSMPMTQVPRTLWKLKNVLPRDLLYFLPPELLHVVLSASYLGKRNPLPG